MTVSAAAAARHLPRVRLRELRADDAALLDRLGSRAVSGPWDYFDDPPHELLRGQDYGGGWRVVEDRRGRTLGSVSFIQIPYGPNRRSLAWRIGITILPEHRHQGFGAAAQRELASQLFATTAANRVEADTDVENVPEQRSLERAGFQPEGTHRGAQFREGRWHDRILYARLRSDA
ncbi:MAG: GNAT family N-acetyltransferase [Candidatus Dormibacteraceae bacterium]